MVLTAVRFPAPALTQAAFLSHNVTPIGLCIGQPLGPSAENLAPLKSDKEHQATAVFVL